MLCGFFVWSLCDRNKPQKEKRLFSTFNIFTIGVFISILFLYFPICYTNLEPTGSAGVLEFLDKLVNTFYAAVFSSVRVFIAEGDYGEIYNVIAAPGVVPYDLYRVVLLVHARLLVVLAPVLTFGTVLTLFKGFDAEWRFFWHRRRPHYIMSELNDYSMALAESIRKKYCEGEIKKRPVIVFTDVFLQDEEDDYELLLRAKSLNAICLKKDVANLNLAYKKNCSVEIFLMSEDDSENLEQAIELTKNYKTHTNFSIYVYSASASTGYVMDSIDKGDNLLDKEFVESVRANPEKYIYNFDWEKSAIRMDGGFCLKRINSVNALAVRTLADKELLKELNTGMEDDKTVSLMIIGMGSYGTEFMKTAVWLYQMEGYKLEITIFDSSQDKSEYSSNNTRKILEHQCPEIMSMAGKENGYDIKIFTDIDCFSSDFDKKLREPEVAERVARTKIALVALGDDDRNIEAAVMLRQTFDRLKALSNSATKKLHKELKNTNRKEQPIIFSVVFDERKALNIGMQENQQLVNYKKTPYNISFIGNLSSQYSYDTIEELKNIERSAFLYHIDWLRKEHQLHGIYDSNEEFRIKVDNAIAEMCRRNGGCGKESCAGCANAKPNWSDEYYY
ncbi:MAG: hypothetical protein IJW21_00150, partial [Clostridia bacterium]|nr:hypothetical protein [Clostridia bacterium]